MFDPGYGRSSWASESEEAEAAKHPAGRQGWLLDNAKQTLDNPQLKAKQEKERQELAKRSEDMLLNRFRQMASQDREEELDSADTDGWPELRAKPPPFLQAKRPPLGGGSSSTGVPATDSVDTTVMRGRGTASKFPPIQGSSDTPATGSDRGAGAWTREVSQRRKDRRIL